MFSGGMEMRCPVRDLYVIILRYFHLTHLFEIFSGVIEMQFRRCNIGKKLVNAKGKIDQIFDLLSILAWKSYTDWLIVVLLDIVQPCCASV